MASHVACTLFTLHFILFSYLCTITCGAFYEEVTEAIAIKRIEKTTHLHFYFHDIVSGKHPTAIRIAGPDNFAFGDTMMADDPLTEGLEISSKPVGKAQGLYALASQNDFCLLMVMNFAFTEGEYNGSSISILGRNQILNDVREMPIVGGSGLFRLAHGYALAHTVWFDEQGDATVEYNVYVSHY
uniref:Dirigent protein n=1 Tax=Populus trichocarpa TaxID=3694 RepID=A0A2K2BR92_POPTR|eukprot:XP_002297761.3 dirigent protein 22 [Populus trichocarpa]